MSDQRNTLEIFEKSKVRVTINLKNDDGTAFDLTASPGWESTRPKLYVHLEGKAHGTNLLSGVTTTIDNASGGVVSYVVGTFAAETELDSATEDDAKGVWQVRLTPDDASEDLWTKPRPFYLRRNVMLADD